jgi:hypothetical protein
MADGYTRDFDSATGKMIDARTAGSRRNLVEFFIHPVHMEFESNLKGRPIYQDREMIRIMVPGDTKTVVERYTTAEDRTEYSREHAAFLKQETLAADGTPLEQWPIMTKAMIRTLKAFNVLTVEHVANLSDDQMSQIGILGLRTTRRQAEVFMEAARTGAVPAALVAENEMLKQQAAGFQQQISMLNARFEEALRASGQNPANYEAGATTSRALSAAVRTATDPASIIAAAKPLAETNDGTGIPEDWDKMPAKDLISLAEKASGVKVANAKAAREIIAEIIADTKA